MASLSKIKSAPQPASSTNNSPLFRMYSGVPRVIHEVGHSEMWGVPFAHVSTKLRNTTASIVLQKFLRAADDNVDMALEHFSQALQWRKHNDPSGKLNKLFDPKKFGDMGFVTCHRASEGGGRFVVTWNLYGVIKDVNVTFGDIEEFLDFRIALMELAVRELNLSNAPAPIPEGGPDPYQIVQVHDCAGSDPFTVYPRVRDVIVRTIDMFQANYPELLAYHHFVRSGSINTMAMKLFKSVVPESLRPRLSSIGKIEYKSSLKRKDVVVKLFPDPADRQRYGFSLPTEFGGNTGSVHNGRTVQFLAPESSDEEVVKDAEAGVQEVEQEVDEPPRAEGEKSVAHSTTVVEASNS